MKIHKVNHLSIKQLLIATGIISSILLFAIAAFTKYSLDKTLDNYELLNNSKNLLISELKMRKLEKDFLAKETINSRYFETGESQYLQDFDQEYKRAIQNIVQMEKLPDIAKLKLKSDVQQLKENFFNYQKNFQSLVVQLKLKGYKDYGLEGQMRMNIHDVEKKLAQVNDLKAEYYMLMLRRHEKDYLIRKDLKYKDEFATVIQKFSAYIEASPHSETEKEELIDLLNNYQNLFYKIVEHDYIIGINNPDGLLSTLNKQVALIEQKINNIQNTIYKSHHQKVSKIVSTLFLIILIFSIGIILSIFKATQIVLKPLNRVKHQIHLLGEGHLPNNLTIEGKNELSQMTVSLNILTENLKNTKEFAIEVGKGKLDTQVNVFNNQGDLGGSLIQMRNELIKVAHEREIQNLNHQNRIWANQTLNEINELLRSKNNTIDELSYSVLSTIIKQLNANQGALFLKSQDSENTFEISALQAYGRKKYSPKKIKIGEDLIGTCAIEKETIYMTDIPKDYIQISSGLGFAAPNVLILVPMKNEEQVVGVIEIASFQNIEKYQIDVIEKIASTYASALISIRQSKQTQELLEASNYQANELEAQSEELRQNMEELSTIQEALMQNENILKQKVEQMEQEKQIEINELKQNFSTKVETLDIISDLVLFSELSPNTTIISASKKLLKTLQLTPNDLNKKRILDFMQIDEQINFEREWQKIVTSESAESIFKLHLDNGKSIIIYNYFTILRQNKKIKKIVAFSKLMDTNFEKALFKDIDNNAVLC